MVRRWAWKKQKISHKANKRSLQNDLSDKDEWKKSLNEELQEDGWHENHKWMHDCFKNIQVDVWVFQEMQFDKICLTSFFFFLSPVFSRCQRYSKAHVIERA